MLRLFLPPNLPVAAPRDAIAVKVTLDLATPPSPEQLPALAALQRFGAQTAPVLFLQLTRAQLRELVQLLRGQPVFASVNSPAQNLLWVGPRLRGVSEHLDEPVAATPPAPASPPSSRSTSDRRKFRPNRSRGPMILSKRPPAARRRGSRRGRPCNGIRIISR